MRRLTTFVHLCATRTVAVPVSFPGDQALPLIPDACSVVGTAFLFALTLVERLCGAEKRKEVYEPMSFPGGYYMSPL